MGRFRAGREAERLQPGCVIQPPPESVTDLLQGRRKPYPALLGDLGCFGQAFSHRAALPSAEELFGSPGAEEKSSQDCVLPRPTPYHFSLRDAKCSLSRDWVKIQLPWNKIQLLP